MYLIDVSGVTMCEQSDQNSYGDFSHEACIHTHASHQSTERSVAWDKQTQKRRLGERANLIVLYWHQTEEPTSKEVLLLLNFPCTQRRYSKALTIQVLWWDQWGPSWSLTRKPTEHTENLLTELHRTILTGLKA